jgi:hypothetical protein
MHERADGPELVDEDKEQEWGVEAIVGHRRKEKGAVEYLVKWKDWPEEHDTWMSAYPYLENARELLDSYQRDHRLSEAGEISSDSHHSVGVDCIQDPCDTGYEEPRPAKRRRLPPHQGGLHSRKRIRRSEDIGSLNAEEPRSYDVSYQAAVATTSCSMQASEEMPIYGYLTLKTIESKVVYCL